MQVLLNIGLESKTLGKIAPVTALSAARLRWLQVKSSAVHHSDTEPTLVILAAAPEGILADVVADLARDLGQDCIAIYDPEYQMGNLAGPRAAEWGPFNPEFFFLLDGTRLQAPVAKAA